MTGYSSIFTLQKEMQEVGFNTHIEIEPTKAYTDEELLSKLNNLLSCINTLDDYAQLIDIIDSLRSVISLRFLYLFFQALVVVEMRIWHSAGMDIPMDKIMDENIDLLLDEYLKFAYNLESTVVKWTKENGYFYDDEKYAFIRRRNEIYARYIVIAGEILGC